VGAGVSGFYLLPYAIVADIVEEDEKRSGESRGGMYYGFESIPLNFFQFGGYLIVGILLQGELPIVIPFIDNILGAVTNLLVNWLGINWGYVLWGPIAVIFIVTSVFIFWKKVNADPLQE